MDRVDLYDISWKVDEETYRADLALSYSTLAKFERSGFNGLSTLFDKIESPSLTFGSAVDALITGGQKEFDDKFVVAEFPEISDTIIKIVKDCFSEFHITHQKLSDIPDVEIIGRAANYNYQNNWKPETRAKVIKEKGEDYYSLLFLCENKTLIDSETYSQVLACVDALKNSPATKWYFQQDDIFDDSVKRYYQLKFKTRVDGIDYRSMMDLIVVDYKNKVIYPIDLKTSSHKEWDFFRSFLDWDYQIQARLYFRVLEQNLKNNPYFKDFTIEDYRFIVVNKETLTPLVWKCGFTTSYGDITFVTKSNHHIILKEPYDIAKELYNYLNNPDKRVPDGISLIGDNSLSQYLSSM